MLNVKTVDSRFDSIIFSESFERLYREITINIPRDKIKREKKENAKYNL